MQKAVTVAQIVVPIFVAIILGVLARRKKALTLEEVGGLQQFVMKVGLPCIVFNSCLTADIGAESLGSIALVMPFVLLATLWSFRARKNTYPYHNLPMLFCAQESGMLGIPLFMMLFGAEQMYRIGVLDMTQAFIAYPVIAMLSSDAGENPSVKDIVKKVLISPLMIMVFLGLGLNLSGIGGWLDDLGIGMVITESTGFLAQPVSSLMIFSVGYNFSLTKGNRRDIFRIAGIHFSMYALFGVIAQAGLLLIPNVDALTRWAVLLFCMLPSSYLSSGLGRNETDAAVASGVCSLLTLVSLAVFCLIVVAVA